MTKSRGLIKKYALPFKIAAALVIFGVLCLRMDWSMLHKLSTNINYEMTGIALALIVLQIGMLAYRWQTFLNAEKHLVGFWTALNITTASQLANSLFITSVGGIIVRVALAQYYGMTLLKALCAAVTDRFMTLLSILLFAGLFIPALFPVLPTRIIESVVVISVIGLVTVILFPSMMIRFLKPFILKNRHLASITIYLRRLMRKPELLGRVLISSFFAQLFYFLSVGFVAQGIGLHFNLWQLLAMLPLITLISSLPIGLGGWGIREGAFVFGLGLIGIPTEMAFLISVQIGVLGILSTLVAAIPAFFTGKLQDALYKAAAYALARKS